MKKHFNYIIANPPYGSIGAKITKSIIDNIDFDQYYNLMPANDYKRVQNLWNYIKTASPVKNGFADAAVTTHIAEISKTKVNNWTKEEFEIEQYIDPSLDKYFKENIKRDHYAINTITSGTIYAEDLTSIDHEVLLGNREVPHGHLPYSRNVVSYKWNKEMSISKEELIEEAGCRTLKKVRLMFSKLTFKTKEEKLNFCDFIYSELGFKFLSKIFVASDLDGSQYKNLLPKVDWTRPWTVEEILRDYNYTEEEIKEVMEDLKNYKGMKD